MLSRVAKVLSRVTSTASLVMLTLLAVACTSTRPERTKETLEAHRQQLFAEMAAGREALSRQVINRIVREQDAAKASGGAEPVLDFLILSGGGDYGAFGAGVLKGWGTVSDSAQTRPVFDIVSGVSTGALIAPLAFAGTEEAYERAFTVYQNPNPDWFKSRGLIAFLLHKESLMDTSGLRRDMQKTIDQPMLRAIADGHDQARVLVIGSTNLDLGVLTMWNAALLAHQAVAEGRPRDRFDDVILASASIPAVFPAVEIDGDLHVDGGVTRNIAYTTDQDTPHSALSIWKSEHSDRKLPKFRIWVIVNNQLATPVKQMGGDWPSMMGRALELSIRASTISSLKGLALATKVARTQFGADVEFHFMSIPDEWRAPVEGVFKKETMGDLARLGYKMGADPASWRTDVPNPETPGE